MGSSEPHWLPATFVRLGIAPGCETLQVLKGQIFSDTRKLKGGARGREQDEE